MFITAVCNVLDLLNQLKETYYSFHLSTKKDNRDLRIVLQNDKIIYCHSHIIKKICPNFELPTTKIKFLQDRIDRFHINFFTFDSNAVKFFIRYVYNGYCDYHTKFKEMIDLCKIASMHSLQDLQRSIHCMFKSSLNSNNVINFYFITLEECIELTEVCLQHIYHNMHIVSNSKEYHFLHPDVKETIQKKVAKISNFVEIMQSKDIIFYHMVQYGHCFCDKCIPFDRNIFYHNASNECKQVNKIMECKENKLNITTNENL